MNYDNIILRDSFDLLCGRKLGSGVYRDVFECAIDDKYVVKVEPAGRMKGINILEWHNWETNRYAEAFSKWLAPCKLISPNGRVLIMRKTEPLRVADLPTLLPEFLMDIKPENAGMLEGRLVFHDYPYLNSTLLKRMHKVDWRLSEGY